VAYSELILRDGETLVLDLHPHWWYLAKAMLATIVAVGIGLLVLIEGWGNSVVNVIVAILVLGALAWLGDRIIYRRGIVAKKGMEIPLQRINTIFFDQRIFERVLGLGDLKIESASKTGAEVFEDIRSPDKVQHEIYAQMEAIESRGYDRLGDRLTQASAAQAPPPAATAPTAPPQGSVAERIAELHQLHTQGAITDAEFEAKKATLLEQM
jgi:uncharacterized membrane protein YdbT with pleckstrin-like domain